MRVFRSVAVLLFLSIVVSPLAAQVDDAVVVTATRVPKRFSDLVSDVTVVRREELERAGQASLANVLQGVPGVEVTQAGGLGSTAQVFLRGANANHTLFLVDGMRVGSASTGLTAIEHLPLDQIERIEVLRGPASSLYGSDAIGGVVQIFTRGGHGNPGVNAFAGYGTHDTAKLGAGYGFEGGNSRFGIQAGAVSSDGISAVRNPAAASFNPDADGYRNRNLSAQFARQLAAGQELGVRAFYSDGKKHFDATPRAFDHRLEESLGAVSAYSTNRIGDRWRSHLNVGTSSDDVTSIMSAAPEVFKTRQDQATWQNDVSTPLGLFIAAFERLDEHVAGTTAFPVRERSVNSLLAGYQHGPGAHQLQASVRHDDNSQFGSHDTWQLGYGHRFSPASRAWASLGTAYKAPTFNQLYFPGFGNAALRPERSRGWEAGLHYTPAAIRYGAVYYRSKITDLIVNVGAPLLAPFNVDQADIRGLTLSASGEAGRATLGASLDLQEPEDATTGRLLPRRAQRHAALRASFPALAGTLTGELVASSERYNDSANLQRMGGYGVVNLAYDIVAARQWKLFARLNNVADKRYELVRDFNVPGRTLFAGMRYEERGF